MGVLQALEAIKLLTAEPSPETTDAQPVKPSLLMFSAYSQPQFRSVRLRSRRPDCAACSARATISKNSLGSGSLDYVAFCGATVPVDILLPESRVSAVEFAKLPRDGNNTLIDVRDETQYAMCALRDSVNVPWTGDAGAWLESATQKGVLAGDGKEKYVVCRLGNDSQLAVKTALDRVQIPIRIKDIAGGFESWRKEVDSSWPEY